jgi:CRISPR-associated endonuclease/helicase Cas3
MEEEIRAGHSVILRVPTGAGKTWAAVAPFVYSLTVGPRIADRLLYALPLRSLASSLHAGVYAKMAGAFGNVTTVGNNREYDDGRRYCSLQIGGQKDDAFFESDLVFTTIDQLLSGYVFLPVSLPDRVGNINAGALVGSLVVLDEVHLLDSAVALGTVVEMLDRLRGVCQFVLMTATTSDRAIGWLAGRLGATAVQVEDSEIRALPSQKTKQRTWRWCGEVVNARTIKAQHNGGRTVVLLNSVAKAQDLFLDLERNYTGDQNAPRLLLLHARYYPEDRKGIESELPDYFGPKATKANVILVTTQVIEAGMDLSADDLHSDLAPMNALVQRAGRSARYEERPIGRVTVYESTGLGPYREKGRLVDATRGVLQSLPAEGRPIDFVEERNWVENVHAKIEEEELKRYDNLYPRRKAVHEAMDEGGRGRLSQLVRDIDSVSVVIAPQPETLFGGRTWPRLLGVSGMSLMSLSRDFKGLAPGRWVAKGAAEREDDERPGVALEWSVLSAGQLRAQWLVAIHPDFASYHPRLGLRLGEGGPQPPVLFDEVPPAQHYDYDFEPWAMHSKQIVAQARTMQPSYARGAGLLAKECGVSIEEVESLVKLTCALHDVGKLTVNWQQRAWHWQDDKDSRARAAGFPVPARPRVPIAHTWFESEADRPFRYRLEYKFPPHAVQGAFAVADAVGVRLGAAADDVWGRLASLCLVTAIARHHGTHTRRCTLFQLPPKATQTVAEALRSDLGGLDLQECCDPLSRDEFPDVLLAFGVEPCRLAWPLYAFLVRRLRLADQRATARLGGTEAATSPVQVIIRPC